MVVPAQERLIQEDYYWKVEKQFTHSCCSIRVLCRILKDRAWGLHPLGSMITQTNTSTATSQLKGKWRLPKLVGKYTTTLAHIWIQPWHAVYSWWSAPAYLRQVNLFYFEETGQAFSTRATEYRWRRRERRLSVEHKTRYPILVLTTLTLNVCIHYLKCYICCSEESGLYWVLGQPGLHKRDPVSKKQQQQTKINKGNNKETSSHVPQHYYEWSNRITTS